MDNQAVHDLYQQIDSDDLSQKANAKQRMAADPMHSVWVGASAGTGKTKVLTDRVLRLLLPRPGLEADSATAPDKILCITFTKAAAAEMAERISKKLGQWAIMSDPDLSDDLAKLLDMVPNDITMTAARQLFAKVVDVAGGMKIMTIHSFCQSVLKRFPVEAGLPPHFEVMDERTALEYMGQSQSHIIAKAQAEPESDLAQAMHVLTRKLQSQDLPKLMSRLAAERVKMQHLLQAEQGYDQTIARLYEIMGIDQSLTEDMVLSQALAPENMPVDDLRRACAALAAGSKTDIARADIIQDFLDNPNRQKSMFLSAYKGVFLTSKDEVRKSQATKAAAKAWDEVIDVMFAEAERIIHIIDQVKTVALANYTKSLLKVSTEILQHYAQKKQSVAALDYDDLIYYTRHLLQSEADAAWVLFKLDQGVDHILVDEAQDTNPEQWHVIESMTREFFAGSGARDDIERTIFVVGDEKQSIFSFQRADPRAFSKMRHYFAQQVETAGKNWRPIDLNVSFRSTSAVLASVDHIFADPVVKSGVVTDMDYEIEHLPFRSGHAGLVEIWPVINPDVTEQDMSWILPEKVTLSRSARQKTAEKIADTIQTWLKSNEMLESKNRPIRPGDVLVLVRSRNEFVEMLIRSLKSRHIPVAGIDRMKLTEQIAVMDLVAAAQFALLPQDDLNLATLLKSPLIGMNEEEVYDLAYGREGTIWDALRGRADDIAGYLTKLMHLANHTNPYDFFAGLLSAPCPAHDVSGRAAILSRLGYDAEDAVHEFLNACLDFESSHPPVMQNFVHWFEKNQAEIKREQEQSGVDQVKIMTVHGSKGLQAPIVFMPDTTQNLAGNSNQDIRLIWPEKEDRDSLITPLWAPRSADQNQFFGQSWKMELDKNKEESKRLLYVAMTRAEDRLYICGIGNKKSVPEECWYNLVKDVFKPLAMKIDFDLKGEPVCNDQGQPMSAWRVYHPQKHQVAANAVETEAPVTAPSAKEMPNWVFDPHPEEPYPPRPLKPSRPDEDEPAMRSPLGDDDGARFKRGILGHQLLEILPEIAPENRMQAAKHYLARPHHQLSKQAQNELAQEVMHVLDHPEFAPIFGPQSLAEIPVTGLVGAGVKAKQVLSGEIDRMVVLDDQVLIVDYKTNRPPPTREEDVAEIYLKQMACYRHALQEIYPDKEIKAALLWTDGPFLMPLSSEKLDLYAP